MASQTQILAGIIQGEASTPADQFGVASVIQNRAAGVGGFPSVFGGGSNDPYAVATAPGQFTAYPHNMQTPSANATALAQALLNGNLSSMGSTGNALYYNAAGNAYPNLPNNSYGPASNAYSDVYNQSPSSNFQLPTLGSSGVPNTPAGEFSQYGYGIGATPPATAPSPATSNSPIISVGPASPTSAALLGPQSGGALTNSGSTSGGGSIVTLTGTPAGVTQGGDTQAASASGQGTLPQAVATGLAAVASTIGGAAASAGASTTSWLTGLENNLGSWFARGAGVFIGAMLIIGALMLLGFAAVGQRPAQIVKAL